MAAKTKVRSKTAVRRKAKPASASDSEVYSFAPGTVPTRNLSKSFLRAAKHFKDMRPVRFKSRLPKERAAAIKQAVANYYGLK